MNFKILGWLFDIMNSIARQPAEAVFFDFGKMCEICFKKSEKRAKTSFENLGKCVILKLDEYSKVAINAFPTRCMTPVPL